MVEAMEAPLLRTMWEANRALASAAQHVLGPDLIDVGYVLSTSLW